MWKTFAMAVLLACACIVAPAQDNNNKQNKGGGNTKNDNTSTSTAGSSSSLTYNGGNSTQFVQALPGSASGVIPGFVAAAGAWEIYRPLTEISSDRLKAGKKTKKPKEAHWDHYGKIEANNDSIHLINWGPYTAGYSEDDVIWDGIAITKPNMPLHGAVLWLLAIAKEETYSRRCSVRFRDVDDQVTNTHSFGVGGAASGTSQSGIGAGGAIGLGIGKSTTKLRGHWEIRAVCLTDGKLQSPEPELVHEQASVASAPAQPPATPAPQPQPATPPPTPVAPEPAPVTTAKVEPTPAPIPVAAQPLKPCAALLNALASDFKDGEFVVHFELDQSKIRDEDRPAIQKITALLKDDRSCKVRPEGDTCTLGRPKHNADLGRKRGWALFEALIKAGGEEIRSQVLPPVSGAYDAPASGNYAVSRTKKPTSEAIAKNRRARLLINPEESGK